MNVGSLADWFQILLTLGAIVVAYSGIDEWKNQTRAAAMHKVALEIAETVGNLFVEFYNQRAPLIEPWELPNGHYDNRERTAGDNAAAYRAALNNRYNKLMPFIMAVHNSRGRAMAVLGRDCAETLVKLAQSARKL
jgi:hypothetical protein